MLQNVSLFVVVVDSDEYDDTLHCKYSPPITWLFSLKRVNVLLCPFDGWLRRVMIRMTIHGDIKVKESGRLLSNQGISITQKEDDLLVLLSVVSVMSVCRVNLVVLFNFGKVVDDIEFHARKKFFNKIHSHAIPCAQNKKQ